MMSTPDAFTVAPDGDEWAVIYHGLTETPVAWRTTRAEAEQEAEWRNRQALDRLAQAGLLERRKCAA